MSHTIAINKVDTKTINGFENVVCRIYYTLTWTDGTNTSNDTFVIMLVDPDDPDNYPDTSELVPYANLTQSQMETWIEGQDVFPKLVLSLSQRKAFAPDSNNPDLPWAS